VIFAAVAMRDGFSGPAAGAIREGAALPGWAVLGGTLVPLLAVCLIVEAWMRLSWRALVRTGDGVIVDRAEAVLSGARWSVATIHVVAVLGLGWMDLVRSVVGDWILLDELIAVLPALGAGAAGWWSYAPIARAVRDATLVGAMERGEPIYPPLSRREYVVMQVRHGIGSVGVPMALIAGWTDVFLRVENWARALPVNGAADGGPLGWLAHSEPLASWLWIAVRVAGVAAVFIVTPGLMRHVWSTVALGPGPVRDRLMALCRREGVKIRDILVWRTQGAIVNGAVMGIVPRLRYVLLTDAMLDRFDGEHLEAVMAHEVAHVRRRHIPWLATVLIVGLLGGGVFIEAGLHALGVDTWDGWWALAATVVAGLASLTSLVCTFVLFGWVSRRFEWQADAFAAQHLTRFPSSRAGERAGETGPGEVAGVEGAGSPPVVTPRAAGAMVGALEAVRRINHIPRWKWSFRHGSIGERQRRLDALVGRPVGALAIDRTVRRIKVATLLVLVIAVAAAATGGVW